MKKLFLVLCIVAALMSGCVISSDTSSSSDTSNTQESTQDILNTSSGSTGINSANSISYSTSMTENSNLENPFFFKSGVNQENYSGSFLFDDVIENDIKLNISEVASLKKGKLFELKLDSIEAIPEDRLNLGCFYVREDKIYKVPSDQESLNTLKSSEELPKDSIVVCQSQKVKDALSENELGLHQYIKLSGDTIEYHSYNNQVNTGYYESFIWHKGKGLVNYRSGYGAESNSIELKLN